MNALRLTWRDRSTVALATVGITAGLVAVNVAAPKPAAAESGLKPFDSCLSLATWYRTKINDDMKRFHVSDPAQVIGGRSRVLATAGVGGQAIPAASDVASSSGASATGTNVQEAGVDEGDSAKVVGGKLITLRGSTLIVVDVSGSTPVELGFVNLATGYRTDTPADDSGAELQVDGDRVLITWNVYNASGWPSTRFAVVDIHTPNQPRVTTQFEVQGRQLTGRLIDGRVRLALTTTPSLKFTDPLSWFKESANWKEADWNKAYAEIAAKNRAILKSATGEDFLPKLITRDASGKVAATTPLVACDAVYHPKQNAGANTLSLLTIDLQRHDPLIDATGVTADGDQVYASTSRFYVATARGGWFWTERPVDSQSAPAEDPSLATEVHAFDITAPDHARYTASGSVDGWVLSQWAMSEQDGLLRVATTRDQRQPRDAGVSVPATDAAITVLREEAGRLSPIGSVGGLGKGEQIRAVRWFGDTAVIVTFRQTDPLYVVDLSDPSRPTVAGELKINGYSAYLHPVGEGQLLGVGQDATDEGRVKGTQVSTFDINQTSAPRRLDVITEPNTGSTVEFDSKAFTFVPDKHLALVPVSDYNGYQRLIAYTVGSDGSLSRTGDWTAKDAAMSLKAMVVDGSSAVAVVRLTEGPLKITKLSLDGLTPTGSLTVS